MAKTNTVAYPKYHHTALARGYVSAKCVSGIRYPYSGKYGEGYTVRRHNPDSTRYCYMDYYVS